MSYLVGEMAAYLLAAAVIGGLVGWFLYRGKCNKAIAELESQIQNLQSEISSYQGALAAKEQQLTETHTQTVQLRSELALAEGNAHLMHSRWQSTLKQARQAPNQLKWIKALQSKLAAKNIQYDQNRQYAEAMALEARNNKENLARVHTRLTEVDAKVAGLKDWVAVFQNKLNQSKANAADIQDWATVFQNKLVKTKTDYGQLRNYATAIANSENAYRDNLTRAHNRLTEIEHKQQPLRTWIRVFQTKLMKTKSEYEQLRNYSESIQTALDAKEDNLSRAHTRLTVVSKELADLKDRRKNPMPPVPPAAEVSDNKALRLVDRIRLLGTSKNAVYGRMHNQIREAKLETIETERVLTDSCEEKDAIIIDLRAQLRKAENRAQKAPVVQLDQTVKIKELESELAQVKADTQSSSELESQLREHRFTIDAYRSKLSATENQLPAEHLQAPASPESNDDQQVEEDIPSSDNRDDLKLIKGVGPKLESMLNNLGVYKFSQIAAWKKADIEEISSKLGSFKDRITRDDWVKKARSLAKDV